jgi:alpha-L-fucosidase
MTKLSIMTLTFVLAGGQLGTVLHAAAPPPPAETPQQQWFRDAKFGMFIHWGLYSELGQGEWVMDKRGIPAAEYEKLAARFNPTEFNAAEWVSIAKGAGMKYITIISKLHDGFAMFATRQSRYNIVDATPYARDPLKMLADECHRQGLKIFFDYSQLDWHHPDYFPLGDTGHTAGRPPGGDWNRYLDFMDAQLTELLTNYGPVGGIWLDGMWDKYDADWHLERTYALIHRLQPAALIGSNHHRKPLPGEDFQTFEKDWPGHGTEEWNIKQEVGNLPMETCNTINDSWGYTENDKHFKSSTELIHYLVRYAGWDSNFLLNVGPLPNGKFLPEAVERLKAVGAWMAANGESIYGTRGGPITPRSWGVTTQKGNIIYVHILDWQEPVLPLPRIEKRIESASMLGTGDKVGVVKADYGTLLKLPSSAHDPIDNIVVLKVR